MSKIQFSIQNWQASAPGLNSMEDWRDWLSQQNTLPEDAKLACDLIPAMMRRRMSSLSKLAVQTAIALTRDTQVDYAIFCSRHGELPRTVTLVESILKGDDASPMAFSQSVHNTAAGLFTIATKQTMPTTSVSAGEDSLHAGLIEAAAYLACHPNHTVLVVDFDEPMPTPYNRFDTVTAPGYALGMLLTQGQQFSVTGERVTGDRRTRPQAFDVIEGLCGQHRQWTISGPRKQWLWSQ